MLLPGLGKHMLLPGHLSNAAGLAELLTMRMRMLMLMLMMTTMMMMSHVQ